MATGSRLAFLRTGVLLAMFAAVPAGAAQAAPASLVASAVSSTIGADGVTGIIAILRNADGTLYAGAPLQVNFSSGCANLGLATLAPTAMSIGGIASVTYLAAGCAGGDQVTATLDGGPGVSAIASVYVASKRNLSPKGVLGRAMYFDQALSASGAMSCASCHSPADNYQAPRPTQTPHGGLTGDSVGFRAAPPASYAALVPKFSWLKTKTGATLGRFGTPRGGLMWDGRAPTLAAQAAGPFVSPHEMANADNRSVMDRLLTRPYFAAFSKAYGPVSTSASPDKVVANMADAIATFERQDPSFKLFTSKYDRVQVGLASFTAQEARGQALFFDPLAGSCAACHDSIGAKAGARKPPQLFSDQSYRSLGVPRNWALPYNDDALASQALADLGLSALANGVAAGAPSHVYYDLGLCGPFRTDSLLDPGLCGAFRVPTLRNVALKHSYEHNGVFAKLSDVVQFYALRDVEPGRFYVTAAGAPDLRYNDLPLQFRGNVQQRVPFRPLPDGTPRLDAGDVKDIVAFLCTLTDGFDPANPGGYRLPAQCEAAAR